MLKVTKLTKTKQIYAHGFAAASCLFIFIIYIVKYWILFLVLSVKSVIKGLLYTFKKLLTSGLIMREKSYSCFDITNPYYNMSNHIMDARHFRSDESLDLSISILPK